MTTEFDAILAIRLFHPTHIVLFNFKSYCQQQKLKEGEKMDMSKKGIYIQLNF